ncbi:MAG: peptidase M28 family protein [Deltaproteobacteria bacterium]|nr:MAG: peptidase M28 family protein [Deltaproteobacteria bacterium]
MADDGAWQKLAHLTDRIGPRLSGSRNLERAIEWAEAALRADGHDNVHREPVMVPHWVRGAEFGAIVAPIDRELAVLGLGGTVATPRRGVTAEVVVVDDFEQLARLGADRVRGKIVLFNKKMPATDPDHGSGYDEAVPYRTRGPVEAAKLGAVAALVRSVTTRSLRSPHTGATRYEDGVRKIPAVAVSTEDADLIARLAAAGERVVVRVRTSGRYLPDAKSANVIAELPGRERPEEIVLIGAHIDSWDVGQGAHDDGTGCAIVMQALTVLRRLGLRPRRTIRVVLFTNEENGLRGARQYAADHASEMANHVAAIESDTGGFKPKGFEVQGGPQALAQAADLVALLDPIGAGRAVKGFGGADLIPLALAGVPALGLWVDGRTYFDIHHTHADTLDKVDPTHLKMNVAAVATMAYALAEMPERFGAADRERAPAGR